MKNNNVMRVWKETIYFVNTNTCQIKKAVINTNHLIMGQEVTNIMAGANLNPLEWLWKSEDEIEDVRY